MLKEDSFGRQGWKEGLFLWLRVVVLVGKARCCCCCCLGDLLHDSFGFLALECVWLLLAFSWDVDGDVYSGDGRDEFRLGFLLRTAAFVPLQLSVLDRIILLRSLGSVPRPS